MVKLNKEDDYEDGDVQEECETEECDCGEEDFAILSTKVEAMLELLIDKKIITEAEFERKYDEICDRDYEEDDEIEEE